MVFTGAHLVAVGVVGLAVGARALDIAVGEEALTLLAILLLRGLLQDVAALQ